MSPEEPTHEQEDQFICEMLRERYGIGQDGLEQVVDLAAIGIVHDAWRNTCVEDWHADGRLDDGDMLRINSHMTWRARQIMRRWTADVELDSGQPLSALDGIPADHIDWLAIRLYQWLVNPSRKLITGVTLGQLAGSDLAEYASDADLRLGGFARQAAECGARFGFARTAAHGALACPHWWGHPGWPSLVSRLVTVLDDPTHDHWGQGGEYRERLPVEPALVANRRLLRRTMLSRPWDMSSECAKWLVNAGIGHLR